MLDAGLKGSGSFADLLPTPEVLSADFARVARADRDAFLAQNEAALGTHVEVVDITDRRRGAPPEDVRMPGGIYIAQYDLSTGIVERALAILDELSPVRTGEYRSHHEVMIGGAILQPPYKPAPGATIRIVNRLVYARRLESSWGGARVSQKTPQGPYWVAARRLGSEFRSAYRVKFGFEGSEAPRRSRKEARYGLDSGKYPALIISPV